MVRWLPRPSLSWRRSAKRSTVSTTPSTSPTRVVSYADAVGIIREQAARLTPVARPASIALLQSIGRVLAHPVLADRDQPPFPRSTRDGFACRAADAATAEALEITGAVRAGETSATVIGPLQAIEIMTGAPVPAGGDCVVMVEHVQVNAGQLRLLPGRSIAAGENIVAQGVETRQGEVVLPAGTRMAAAQVAAAAACGAAQVSVYRRPRVAIVATGDELVELDEAPQPYQIRNSNSYSLAAQVEAAGGEPMRLAIARDDRGHLEGIIGKALDADLLLLSGGVSMGKYDLVEEVLHSLGAEFFFTGALIQPGKPVVFGKLPQLYFFGLPGNPVSTMVTFLLFVQPLLGALGGDRDAGPRFALARLGKEVRVKAGLTRFLPAVLSREVTVETVAWQGSGDLAATSRANCFLVIPADVAHLAAGETVSILLG